jgi:hypothetical protein
MLVPSARLTILLALQLRQLLWLAPLSFARVTWLQAFQCARHFFLLHQAGFLQVPGVNPGFTTEVDFDCRCDYADLFGIPPGLQVCFERAVSDLPLMGELPLFLSRLMS